MSLAGSADDRYSSFKFRGLSQSPAVAPRHAERDDITATVYETWLPMRNQEIS